MLMIAYYDYQYFSMLLWLVMFIIDYNIILCFKSVIVLLKNQINLNKTTNS